MRPPNSMQSVSPIKRLALTTAINLRAPPLIIGGEIVVLRDPKHAARKNFC